jgi:hypothetical protein
MHPADTEDAERGLTDSATSLTIAGRVTVRGFR